MVCVAESYKYTDHYRTPSESKYYAAGQPVPPNEVEGDGRATSVDEARNSDRAIPCPWSPLRITRHLAAIMVYVTLAVGADARAAEIGSRSFSAPIAPQFPRAAYPRMHRAPGDGKLP